MGAALVPAIVGAVFGAVTSATRSKHAVGPTILGGLAGAAGGAALGTVGPAIGAMGVAGAGGGIGAGSGAGGGLGSLTASQAALQTGAPAAIGKLGATKAIGGLGSSLATTAGAAGPAFTAGGGTMNPSSAAWTTKNFSDLAGMTGFTGGGSNVAPAAVSGLGQSGGALTAGQVATQTGAPATLGLAKGAIGNAGGGMLSKLAGLIPSTTSGKMQAVLGLGSVADYFTKNQQIGKQQEAANAALSQYLGQFKDSTEWSAADREAMMKGIYGIYADEEAAIKRQGAASAAARGTGGGAYGKTASLARQRGLEQAARALATTYGPSGVVPSFSPYQLSAAAGSRDAASETVGDLLGLGGQLSSLYFARQLFG